MVGKIFTIKRGFHTRLHRVTILTKRAEYWELSNPDRRCCYGNRTTEIYFIDM